MKRTQRRIFNLFAFCLLAFSIYLNFFYKEGKSPQLKKQVPEKAVKQAANIAGQKK